MIDAGDVIVLTRDAGFGGGPPAGDSATLPAGTELVVKTRSRQYPEGWSVFVDVPTDSGDVREGLLYPAEYKPAPPVVVIVENPQADPSWYAVGDVEVIYLSSYPASQWAAAERRDGVYEGYGDDVRAIADRLARRPGSEDAVTDLRGLAASFDVLVEKGE